MYCPTFPYPPRARAAGGHVVRRGVLPRRGWVVTACLAAGFSGLVELPPVAPSGLFAQAAERNLIEAVVDAFPRGDRPVYVSPTLLMKNPAPEIRGAVRHTKEELEVVRKRYGARILTPDQAIVCEDPRRPETCVIPGNGILFQFLLPDGPMRAGKLSLDVIVYYSGKGKDGQILREAWSLVATRYPGAGWVVQHKERFAVGHGPR